MKGSRKSETGIYSVYCAFPLVRTTVCGGGRDKPRIGQSEKRKAFPTSLIALSRNQGVSQNKRAPLCCVELSFKTIDRGFFHYLFFFTRPKISFQFSPVFVGSFIEKRYLTVKEKKRERRKLTLKGVEVF